MRFQDAFKCPFASCPDGIFNSTAAYESHKEMVKMTRSCRDCGFEFSSRKEWKAHTFAYIANQRLPGQNRLQCPWCKMKFNGMSELLEHVLHHNVPSTTVKEPLPSVIEIRIHELMNVVNYIERLSISLTNELILLFIREGVG
jgi:hypothetical protein